ncbi:MAG: PH domain-containing protein [Deltaproteobacteria bacterium]|nr:PH domain-containing protein [Deltaproteobacteria bacterium]
MRYSTKIDWWIVALLGSGVGLVLFSSVVLLVRHEGNDIPLGIGGILTCLGVLFISLPTRYAIDENQLLVHAGPFRWRIPVEKILTVHRTNNPLGAPAWSLKRLNVRYIDKKGKETFVLISPKNRKEFIEHLLKVSPDLKRMGDRVERQPGGGEA